MSREIVLEFSVEINIVLRIIEPAKSHTVDRIS